jgi:hypothetical protein
MTPWSVLRETVGKSRGAWLVMTLGFTALYHLALLVAASFSTGLLPNYIRFYDWPANVLQIIRSTPAVRDMPPLISDEWLLETGAMNYNFGHGVAEWSLAIIPSHLVVTMLVSALVATSILLMKRARDLSHLGACTLGASGIGVGAVSVGAANVTMSWVACCATPSWVVGLSLLGLETSSAFALLPYGSALALAGFAVLAATTYFLAWRCMPRAPRRLMALAARPVVQEP